MAAGRDISLEKHGNRSQHIEPIARVGKGEISWLNFVAQRREWHSFTNSGLVVSACARGDNQANSPSV